MRARRWPWVMLVMLATVAFAVFFVLPRFAPDIPRIELPFLEPPAAADSKSAAAQSTVAAAPTAVAAEPAAAESGAPRAAAEPRISGAAVEPGVPVPAAEARVSGPAATSRVSAPAPRGRNSVPAAASHGATAADPGSAGRLAKARANFEQRLAALEARGAGIWGGSDFATAKARAAEAIGANDAGSPRLAEDRLIEALRLLGNIESRAAQAFAMQLAAGQRALAAGQGEVAKQAFDLARRIDSGDRRAAEGLQRVRSLGGVLPLLADGENAEVAKDYGRAAQDFSQALSLDPGNDRARAGLARAHAAFGEDTYAKAVGSGFAALGAGRLDDARTAFEKGRGIRPSGAEAANGLTQVGAALRARGFASTRQRGVALEATERWGDALAEYDAALKVDPSLAFAQAGKARAAARLDLSNGLQELIDRPERLATPAVREEAAALMRSAETQDPSGPVLRSQLARLQMLLPEFNKPVRLALVSDNATQVAIQRVGSFGTFARREIELKPGKYTVVGTREGYRDVRRDVTIAPGRDVQTISVSCVEPI